MHYMAESRGWPCSEKTDFCKQRSCEDQISRIKFQQRGLMAVLEPSIEFGSTLRHHLRASRSSTRLYIKPEVRVQINGEKRDSIPLKQVLPQVAFPSLLPFLLYIDDLRSVVP